ncbi:MAG: PAS domain-containing protein [Lachnospiraceae bacterium]|nr:PAS domain-containing protein [Lachnospiraceae bacterium]
MMLNQMIKSVLEQDRASVVLCDLNHVIVYMNPAAIRRYEKRGGAALLGKSLLNCHNEKSNQMIEKVVAWFNENQDNNMIYTYHNEKENKDVYMVALRDEDKNLIGYYEKHEYRDAETAAVYDFSKSLV